MLVGVDFASLFVIIDEVRMKSGARLVFGPLLNAGHLEREKRTCSGHVRTSERPAAAEVNFFRQYKEKESCTGGDAAERGCWRENNNWATSKRSMRPD